MEEIVQANRSAKHRTLKNSLTLDDKNQCLNHMISLQSNYEHRLLFLQDDALMINWGL